jgi:hypothetical protein
MELCTWVTFLITFHLQKCFVINVMKKSGYIYRGNFYLSAVRQMSAISRLWLWYDRVTDGFLIPFCQQLAMWFILKDTAATMVWGVTNNLNVVRMGVGRLQLATQVSCPVFSCVFTRFSRFISNSRYDSGIIVAWCGQWVQSYVCQIFRRKAVRAQLCADCWKKADLKKLTFARLGSSSTQRRQNERKYRC